VDKVSCNESDRVGIQDVKVVPQGAVVAERMTERKYSKN
jgi:hypothetical protein